MTEARDRARASGQKKRNAWHGTGQRVEEGERQRRTEPARQDKKSHAWHRREGKEGWRRRTEPAHQEGSRDMRGTEQRGKEGERWRGRALDDGRIRGGYRSPYPRPLMVKSKWRWARPSREVMALARPAICAARSSSPSAACEDFMQSHANRAVRPSLKIIFR